MTIFHNSNGTRNTLILRERERERENIVVSLESHHHSYAFFSVFNLLDCIKIKILSSVSMFRDVRVLYALLMYYQPTNLTEEVIVNIQMSEKILAVLA